MSILRVVTLVLSFLLPQFAHALAQRTFVASTGNDANACTLAAPCRSFGAAIAQVMPAGIVAVLDSAGYGPVDVNMSVSIIAPEGVYAGITVAPTGFQSGVFISVGNFNVTLRGLTISGSNGDPDGILAENSGTLNVDSCIISNTARGIYVSASGPLKLSVRDTVIRDPSQEGMIISGGSGLVQGVVDHVHVDRAGASGIAVSSTTNVEVRNVVENSFAAGVRIVVFSMTEVGFLTVTNSLVSRNGTGGVFAFANHGAVTLVANGNTVTSNGNAGISGSGFNGGTATVFASRNTVTLNPVGMDGNGSAFTSVSDNAVTGNGTDVSGPITFITWK
jgi:hypothetical protein